MIKNIGLDIGNITTVYTSKKGTNIIESRLKAATELNKLSGSSTLKTNDNEYLVGVGKYENNTFKHQKPQFELLLQYALADAVSDNSNVNICIGIPPKHFTQEYKKELASILRKHNNIDVRINDKRKRVSINRILIRPESYGVFKTFESKKLITKGIPTIVNDIGGGTWDLSIYDHTGKFIDGTSIEKGLLLLYDRVKVYIFNKTGIQLSIEEVKEYCDGNFKLHGLQDDLHIEQLEKYYRECINDILGIYKDFAKYNIIVSSGGCKLLKPYFKKDYSHALFDENITTNADAFYQICKQEFGE